MVRMMLFLGLLGSSLGCITTHAAPSASVARSRYELVATTKDGVAAGGADYTYYQVSDAGKKTALWSVPGGAYAHHWISPSGYVWVMSTVSNQRMIGGMQLWVRDPGGRLKGTWSEDFVAPFRMTGGKKPTVVPGPKLDTSKVEALSPRPNIDEQLMMRYDNGDEIKVTLFMPPKGEDIYYKSEKKKGDKTPGPILDTALEDPDYDIPTIEKKMDSLGIWRAKSHNPAKHDLIWTQTQFPGPELQSNRLETIQSQNRLDEMPESVGYTPAHFIYMFEFGSKTAQMNFMTVAGKMIHSTDLVKLGGFRSAQEAKDSLTWQKPLVPFQQDWIPISEYKSQMWGGRDLIEMRDKQDRRFEVQLAFDGNDTRYKEKVTEGLAARRTTEFYDDWSWKVTEERSVSSHSGQFTLRVRRFEPLQARSKAAWKELPQAITLLLNTTINGKKVPVEIWTQTWYKGIPGMAVTDNGIGLVFWTGQMSGEKNVEHDYATLMGWKLDGEQLMGEDPLTGWGYKTLKALDANVQYSGMSVKELGKPTVQTIAGIKLDIYPAEEIRIPTKDKGTRIGYLMSAGGRLAYYPDQPWIRKQIEGYESGAK